MGTKFWPQTPDRNGPVMVSYHGPCSPVRLSRVLDRLLRTTGGTWIAANGASDAYLLVRIAPSPAEPRGHQGYAEGGLGALCYGAVDQARFRARDWAAYRAMNLRFADGAAAVAPPGSVVWVHGRHLALVPRFLRVRRPDIRLVFSWHDPWPEAAAWQRCPQRSELVAGIAGADLVALPTAGDASRFRASGPGMPMARALPAPVDHVGIARAATREDGPCGACGRSVPSTGGGVLFGLGVDDVSNADIVATRLRALGRVLARRPEYRGRLTFLQVASTAWGVLGARAAGRAAIRHAALAVNWRHAAGACQPVVLLEQRLGLSELARLYRRAAFTVVTPHHEGMDAPAREFVAARADGAGVLILSRAVAGAGHMGGAVTVDPADEEDVAAAMDAALDMPRWEQRSRMLALRAVAERFDTAAWWRDTQRALGALCATRPA